MDKSAEDSQKSVEGSGEAAEGASGKFSKWEIVLANLASGAIQRIIDKTIELAQKIGELTVKAVGNYADYEQLVGGEAGDEAIAPIDTLQNYVRIAVSEQNKELLTVLNMIADDLHDLREMYGINDSTKQIADAISNMKFEINNREFARMVKAV